MRLEGKVAVITGSSSGIGKATAERFAAEGAAVVVNGYPPERGEEVAAAIRDAGGRAAYREADVRRGRDLQGLIRFTLKQFGRIDILMNNAMCGRSDRVIDQREGDWDEVFASTVRAAFLGSKYALPAMIEQGGGSIINTASVHALLGARGRWAAYDSAKAALVNLTRQMAVDYGRHGVRVNAICPGWIVRQTPEEWRALNPKMVLRNRLLYPLGRPGHYSEVANAALFLASDEASFVTGHALVVDGGLTAQLQDALVGEYEAGLAEPEGERE
jgi:NAD(P)-dependent dehydrogenase (short-subunit alcohol dehydrogenase family)